MCLKKSYVILVMLLTTLFFSSCEKEEKKPNLESSIWWCSLSSQKYEMWIKYPDVEIYTVENGAITLDGYNTSTYSISENTVRFDNFIWEKDHRSLPFLLLDAECGVAGVSTWKLDVHYRECTNHLYKIDGDYQWTDEVKSLTMYLSKSFDSHGNLMDL